MRASSRRRLVLLGAVLALFAANALFGGSSSEKAIQTFDQHLSDAFADKAKIKRESVPRINGFDVERRIPIFVLSYYRGQSLMGGRGISCASPDSVVVWYSLGATMVWQDGLWFPDRQRVHQHYAATGLLP
jgi:hypothetical protein